MLRICVESAKPLVQTIQPGTAYVAVGCIGKAQLGSWLAATLSTAAVSATDTAAAAAAAAAAATNDVHY